MDGFLSTSLDFDKAFEFVDKYKNNAFLYIEIRKENLGDFTDWGFAYIKEYS